VDPASRGWFDADPTRLRQVLVNLISNAVKFTEAGGVTVTARAIDDRIEFAVTDTGIGIAVDKLPHLFGKFTQADQSISRRFGGTGLGLAISQEFVALMGGKIEVESEPGRGSTFRFALSLKPAQPKDAPAAARPQPATSPLAGRRVLLVEDDPTNRFAGAEMLRRCGAEVEVAENGEDGLHKAAAARFDLILMDMQMPRMDGLSATRHLRAHAGPNRATPIVALTANAFTDDVAQCLAAGMNAHLAKPLRRATIEAEVPKFLAHARGDAAA
jgi:CheY-like chemotaxis protein/anti-sigma regulatory factor (Ser/Thr protein kinase)